MRILILTIALLTLFLTPGLTAQDKGKLDCCKQVVCCQKEKAGKPDKSCCCCCCKVSSCCKTASCCKKGKKTVKKACCGSESKVEKPRKTTGNKLLI